MIWIVDEGEREPPSGIHEYLLTCAYHWSNAES